MQRIHVICHAGIGTINEKTYGLADLNKLLDEGWYVQDVHQMSTAVNGGQASYSPSYALAFRLGKDDGK